MPVTFDNGVYTSSTGTVSQLTFTVGSNAVILAFVTNDSTSNFSVSAIAYNGAAFTRLGQVRGFGTGVSWPFELWGLSAQASGAHTLSAQFTASDRWYMGILSYTNVKDTTPFGTVGAATGTSQTVMNLSLSSTNTDLCVFGFIGTQNITPGNGTIRVTDSTTGIRFGDIAGATGPTTSISGSLAASGSWMGIGISLRFSASGVVSRRLMALIGAGY